MKEKNKIELTKIATILNQIDSSLIIITAMHDLGERIDKVVEDELIKK